MTPGASHRRGALLAWAAWGLALVLAVAYVGLVLVDRSQGLHVYGFVGGTALIALAFATVGALITSRNPGNAVGWVFIASGICLLAVGDAQLYAVWDTQVAPHALPGGLCPAGWEAGSGYREWSW